MSVLFHKALLHYYKDEVKDMSVSKNISLVIRLSKIKETIPGAVVFSSIVSCIRNCFSTLFLEVLHALYR